MIYQNCHNPERIKKRFWGKVEIGEPTECWLWKAGLVHGYGQFKYAGRNVTAHRFAYAITYPDRPIDSQIVHVCKNRQCCNPGHLRQNSEVVEMRFWEKVNVKSGSECWEWTGCISGDEKDGGYGSFVDGARRQVKAHRMAWIITNGNISEGICVCHKCDNRKCCNPEHLFLGTQKDNMIDCSKKNRINKMVGELAPMVKLTEVKVNEIREWYKPGRVTMKQLAKDYGVARTTIGAIVRRESWAHI